MHEQPQDGVNRRDFLQAGAATAGLSALAATPLASGAAAQDAKADDKPKLPTRKLGNTGIDVTILNQGTWRASGLDRILRFAYANGIRYFDTAKSYGSEPGIRRWLEQNPAVRKDIFLVTKDSPNAPEQLIPMLDDRLKALGVDHVDLIFVHALGDHNPKHGVEWPKSKEFRETVEKIKKSGKAKFVGFSTHHAQRAKFLQSAAEGGFVDVIMLQYTPWLDKDSELNKALDACHKKGSAWSP